MNEHDEFYAQVGLCIRKARKKSKMTQEQLADAVELTRTSITNIERGRQRLPLHTLAAIATSLQVEITELLPEEQQPELETLRRALSGRPTSERQWVENVIRSIE